MECYFFKHDKDIRMEAFSVLGTLLKSYNHSIKFVVCIVQLIKMHEHLVNCVPEGIQLLVESFNCKSLVRNFVREITEWQTGDNLDNQVKLKFLEDDMEILLLNSCVTSSDYSRGYTLIGLNVCRGYNFEALKISFMTAHVTLLTANCDAVLAQKKIYKLCWFMS